jgi:tRNAThr (cytosine32-N3)-methyltransferase
LALLFTGSAAVPTQKQSQPPIIEYVDEAKDNEEDGGRFDPSDSRSGMHTPSNTSHNPPTDTPPLPSPDLMSPTANRDNAVSTPFTTSGSPVLDPCMNAQSGPEPGPSGLANSATHFATIAASKLPHPLFKIEQLGVDRRLLVNRKRQLKMYRVWMQGKFRKL